ncbi:40S ribosomal protein S30-A [Pneumocystis jirovecii RU7]|uniref:40S ribosomal protein S30 n=1 Tax=Pneumocystis jirovecii (strain RU7) TaxID=1408657 RepID=A0A0W4ZS35_PNEJ7|nr:40S ribosomal protein S30-A [Pneumocystis jirovecii RU7]KTW31157.1 40S ribosomal protein S30-A [Pneumocystis jirovecii RU7]
MFFADLCVCSAGKVKSQTPKVEKQEKPKKACGRARKRILYNRRFVNVTLSSTGKRKVSILRVLLAIYKGSR